jgi:thiol-disulfide isomerase/thioredoxin
VLVVFVQAGCGPCQAIIQDLNALARKGDQLVVAINNTEPDIAREWTEDVKAEFPVLIQEKWKVSRSFEVYATPFAFLIDAEGVVQSAGIVGSKQYLSFVLNGAGRRATAGHPEPVRAESGNLKGSGPVLTKEESNV